MKLVHLEVVGVIQNQLIGFARVVAYSEHPVNYFM